ncbi:MAG: DUF2461 domain-containing protein [Bacteroidota bacterium]
MEQVLQFLQELAENNNREWFEANRTRYTESREKMLFLTDVLINEIRKFDSEIAPMNPKDCLFRIFRDVRFSKDKRPYKTNFGSFIAPGGRKSGHAGYYFHVEPSGSFVGGGIYMPPAGPLKAIRKHIEHHPEEFLGIINHPDFKAIFPEMMDHQLKTAPKGFAKDHPLIHLLRYKSFAFSARLNNEILINGDFIGEAVKAYRELHKANAFLNEAIDSEKN